jgi:diguanylate cyclase (GGDEF)-like protein
VPRASGKPVWLRPYITETLNERVISYNVPIYFEGQFIGVIGIELDYKFMAEQVSNITLYKNGYAFINEPDGSIVCHPRIDVARMLEPPKVPSELLNNETIVRYTFDGVEKMAVGLPLVNGMQLHVTVPLEEISATWKNWVKNLLTVFAVLLAVFLVIVLLYSEQITKPLCQLSEAAKQIGKGNYEYKMEYTGTDEVGDLTRSIKTLANTLKEQISNLDNQANKDALTSLRNKRSFDTFLNDMEVELNSGGKKMEFALCIFDCNYLKNINDTCGHDKGDLYLQKTASVICDVFKHSPVFRIGGDEFAAILTGIDYKNRDHLTELFQKTCESIRKTNTERWEQVDVAWGLAVYDPKEDNSVNDVFRRADRLMYQNKWSGRDLTSPGKNR